MATMYAWTEIRYGADVDEKTGVVKSVKRVMPGETVTASKLGLDDDAFQQLVDGGSVREYPFPKKMLEDNDSRSPVEYLREQAEQAATLGGAGSYFAPAEEAVLSGAADAPETDDKGEVVKS